MSLAEDMEYSPDLDDYVNYIEERQTDILQTFKWKNRFGLTVDIRTISEDYFVNLCRFLRSNLHFSESAIEYLRCNRVKENR